MTDDQAFVWNRPAQNVRQAPAGPPGSDLASPPAQEIARSGENSPPVEMRDSRSENETDRGEAVLVPLDQWTRILNQLGNLHEAGQQLADARERAAKAETRSEFLRERLDELRSRLESAERAAAAPPPEPEPAPSFGVWFLRRRLDRLARR